MIYVRMRRVESEHNQCQTVWIKIRTDILWVLIWVHSVCKGYQQTAKIAASEKRTFFHEYNQCQTVWIKIRIDILWVLIWVHSVCKGYQQTAKIAASNERT